MNIQPTNSETSDSPAAILGDIPETAPLPMRSALSSLAPAEPQPNSHIAPNSETAPRPSTSYLPESIEPWPDPVDPSLLLDELAAVLSRFVVLPEHAAETLALWSLHTYAFQLRDVSTYIGLASPEKRCGKTTLLGVLSQLVHRPVVAANISPSAFFRVIEETRPTLLIDEADTFLQGNDELRGIFNSGYHHRTAFVVRVAPSIPDTRASTPDTPQSSLRRYSCWCPKILATIGRFPDTLADRCIVIQMQRKMTDEVCERSRNLDASKLRRCCMRFVQDHADSIRTARPQIPAALNDRAADIWEPLLVLADFAGNSWPERARKAALALCARAEETSPIGSLLFDIFFAFALSSNDSSAFAETRLLSRDLVARLNLSLDRPWAESRNGKPITELWLSRQLRPYDIRPRTLRVGELIGKGYQFDQFTEVFHRYMPKSELDHYKSQFRPESAATP